MGFRPGGSSSRTDTSRSPWSDHRQASRDRRRGHDEQIATETFVSKLRALQDTESVLLVDDCEAELFEPNALLDESVGADHEMDLTVFDLSE